MLLANMEAPICEERNQTNVRFRKSKYYPWKQVSVEMFQSLLLGGKTTQNCVQMKSSLVAVILWPMSQEHFSCCEWLQMVFKDLKSEVCKFAIMWNLKLSVHHTGLEHNCQLRMHTDGRWFGGVVTLLCSHNRLWPSKYKILIVRPFIEKAWWTLPYRNISKYFYVFWVEPQTSRSPNSNLTLESVTDSQVASEGILSILPGTVPRWFLSLKFKKELSMGRD